MNFENLFVIAPPLGLAVGFVAHLFGMSTSAAVIIATSIALFPYAMLAVFAMVVVVFCGGFNNDRPPCECGKCSSNQYSYDENETAVRNRANAASGVSEWCYRCPQCQRSWVARDNVFYRVEGDRLIPYRKQTLLFGRWVAVVDERVEKKSQTP